MTNRQHYVPAGYLAGFTNGGTRDSVFFVHSLDGSVRRGKPDNVAFENDYNSIYAEGFAKDHLEDIFSKNFEAPACALFKDLSATPRVFSNEDELSIVIIFVALQAA
jgi:hypothetical protein